MSHAATHRTPRVAPPPKPKGLEYTYSRQQIGPKAIYRTYKRTSEEVQRSYSRA